MTNSIRARFKWLLSALFYLPFSISLGASGAVTGNSELWKEILFVTENGDVVKIKTKNSVVDRVNLKLGGKSHNLPKGCLNLLVEPLLWGVKLLRSFNINIDERSESAALLMPLHKDGTEWSNLEEFPVAVFIFSDGALTSSTLWSNSSMSEKLVDPICRN